MNPRPLSSQSGELPLHHDLQHGHWLITTRQSKWPAYIEKWPLLPIWSTSSICSLSLQPANKRKKRYLKFPRPNRNTCYRQSPGLIRLLPCITSVSLAGVSFFNHLFPFPFPSLCIFPFSFALESLARPLARARRIVCSYVPGGAGLHPARPASMCPLIFTFVLL